MLTLIITTYNRWSSCAACLHALLQQNSKELTQIIVVDDFSSEPQTDDIKHLLENPKVTFVRHASNQGLPTARNTAISLVRTEFFSFCDDDDIWLPDMASQLLAAVKGKGMAIGVPASHSRWWQEHIKTSKLSLVDLFYWGVTPPVGSQIYKTSIINQVDAYNDKVTSGVDHDLWVRLLTLNPSVGIAIGAIAIVGKGEGFNRMTTAISKRERGINRSLEIWKPSLEQAFGSVFFDYFSKSYNTHIRVVFAISLIRSGNYLQVLKKLIRNPNLIMVLTNKLLISFGIFRPTGSNFGVFKKNAR